MRMGGHERGYLFDWRSSTAPKKLAASCKIAFARTSSRFSLRKRRDLGPQLLDRARRAASAGPCRRRCFTQFINVAGFTFSFGARRSTAAERDSSGPISSNTNLTA